MSRVSRPTSESWKNASGQEAFGSKVPETPVVESPAASATDVMSATVGAGATAAFEADKAGLVHLPPPEVRAVTAAPLARRRHNIHRTSLMRAWRW
jgi:hypothetical protein